MSKQLTNDSEKLKQLNNNDYIVDEDSQYYLTYLTPYEIFDQHFIPETLENSLALFVKLCKAHNVPTLELLQASKLFTFLLAIEKTFAKEERYVYTWDNFNSKLIFSNSFSLFDNYINNEKNLESLPANIENIAKEYFWDYLECEKLDYDDGEFLSSEQIEISDIIDDHNAIAKIIVSVFELNQEVKELLLSKQNVLKHSFIEDNEKESTYNIAHRILFDSKINQEQHLELTEYLNKTKQIISYSVYEQTILHNITQGASTKNSEQLFTGLDDYVKLYMNDVRVEKVIEGNIIDNLNIEDIINIFGTDYFLTIQNPESKSALNIFELMFAYYDEDIFKSFIKRYNIPLNIVLRVEKNKINYYLPLLEYAMIYFNYSICDSLIRLGFSLNSFTKRIVENDVVFNYQYQSLDNLYLMNEHSILYLINNGFINYNSLISYQEEFENTCDVKENIFFYLSYKQFNDAFIRLYEYSLEKNNDFTTKAILNNKKEDLLSYYLTCVFKKNKNNFDIHVLNSFLKDEYVINEKEISQLLKLCDRNTAIDLIYYLIDLFPNELKQNVSIKIQPILKNSNDDLVSWFDKTKLSQHFKSIEKDKDSANKDYIKNMLSSNHHLKPQLSIQDESFFDELQEQFPNFEEVIRFYKSQFRLNKLSGKRRITPVLLLGEPGIGKTFFAQKLAQHLNTGYTFLDMASVTANWILTGNNGTWKSAKQGKILEAMMNSKTISPVLLMDEIEKAHGGEHDPTMSLYQLLEEINAKSFTDEFIDFSFDASNIIYIACANTLGHLSEPLQTRFKIFNISKPNEEQLHNIINNIYHDATKDAQIFDNHLDNDIIDLLKKETLRSIKTMIDESIGKSLLELSTDEMNKISEREEKIVLKLSHFQSPIKKRSIGFSKDKS